MNNFEKEVTDLLKKVEAEFQFPRSRDENGNAVPISSIDFMADIVKDEYVVKERERERKENEFFDKNNVKWNYSSSLEYEAIHRLRDMPDWFKKYCNEQKLFGLYHSLTEYLKAIKCSDLYYY